MKDFLSRPLNRQGLAKTEEQNYIFAYDYDGFKTKAHADPNGGWGKNRINVVYANGKSSSKSFILISTRRPAGFGIY